MITLLAILVTMLIVWETFHLFWLNDLVTEVRHIKWSIEMMAERKEE